MNIKIRIQQYGYLNSLIRSLKLILRKLGIKYEVYLYCTKDLSTEIVNDTKPTISGTVQELNRETIENSNIIIFSKEKKNLFIYRLENQYFKGYGFFHNDALVYYTWVSLKDFEMSVPVKGIILDGKDGLLIDSYCHENFRKYGIHQYMNNFRLQILKKLGKQKVVAIVLKENIPARKTQNKFGFTCEKVIIYIRIWCIYEKTIVKYKHVVLC